MRRALLAICSFAVLTAAEAPSKFATLDGARVHYKSYGAGKEAVVFIHGWTCDLTFWRMQAPFYEKHRSLLIDLPGHGSSDKPEVSYTQDLFARAVEAAMRDAGVEKAVLVGHSMGTPVGVTFLRRYREKAAGLVIVDGFIPRPPKDDAEREKSAAQAAAMVKMYRAPDYKTATAKMIDAMFSTQAPEALREEIRSKMLAAPQHVLASAMEGMMALGQLRWEGVSFDVPALGIMAKRSSRPPGPPDHIRTMLPKLRGYQEWEGAGHFLMMEQPERFNAALAEFVSSLASSR